MSIIRSFCAFGLVTLAAGVLVAAGAADAQQQARKAPRIGVLMLASPPSAPDWKKSSVFLQELNRLGWREGKNVTIEYRWAARQGERLPGLAKELVQLPVDVIVVADTPAIRAAQRATTTIPIVALSVGDLVGGGFAASHARPGGNLTGVGGLVAEASGKRLALLKEAVPGAARVAVLVHPSVAEDPMVRDLENAARTLGVQLEFMSVDKREGFEPAFDRATRAGAKGLVVLPAVFFALHHQQIAALALENRLPAIFHQRRFAEAGGLIAYGPRSSDMWRSVALQVDRILKGVAPKDLPIEQPMKFELVINLKTAKAMGLTLPATLLIQADEVIR